jgi:hypothetical protein
MIMPTPSMSSSAEAMSPTSDVMRDTTINSSFRRQKNILKYRIGTAVPVEPAGETGLP